MTSCKTVATVLCQQNCDVGAPTENCQQQYLAQRCVQAHAASRLQSSHVDALLWHDPGCQRLAGVAIRPPGGAADACRSQPVMCVLRTWRFGQRLRCHLLRLIYSKSKAADGRDLVHLGEACEFDQMKTVAIGHMSTSSGFRQHKAAQKAGQARPPARTRQHGRHAHLQEVLSIPVLQLDC